jgi:hypothetical protein
MRGQIRPITVSKKLNVRTFHFKKLPEISGNFLKSFSAWRSQGRLSIIMVLCCSTLLIEGQENPTSLCYQVL